MLKIGMGYLMGQSYYGTPKSSVLETQALGVYSSTRTRRIIRESVEVLRHLNYRGQELVSTQRPAKGMGSSYHRTRA